MAKQLHKEINGVGRVKWFAVGSGRRPWLQEDYKTLTDFANRPWAFKVDDRVHCWQSNLEPAESTLPVKLVIFDLDGALTLYTFMPEDHAADAFCCWGGWDISCFLLLGPEGLCMQHRFVFLCGRHLAPPLRISHCMSVAQLWPLSLQLGVIC